MIQDESDLFVLPVKYTGFFVFSATYSGVLLSQILLSGTAISLDLLWSVFLLTWGIQFLYIGFIFWITYRSIKEKPIEPFMFLQKKNVVSKDESDLIS